jgi:hypothetical protein
MFEYKFYNKEKNNRDIRCFPSLNLFHKIGLVIFFFFAITYFIVRGPTSYILTPSAEQDFTPLYLAAGAWVKGLNPYDYTSFREIWNVSGGKPNGIPDARIFPIMYPISIFPLLAPLTLLGWPKAKIIWLLINQIALFGQLAALLKLSKIKYNDSRALLLFGGAIVLSPVHTAIALGQPIILTTFCAVLSLLAATEDRKFPAAILLGLSVALKANVGIFFLLFYGINRQWHIVRSSFFVIIIIGVIGISRLGWENLTWLNTWQENIQSSYSPGSINDPTGNNPKNHQFLNLDYPLHTMIKSRLGVHGIVILITSIGVYFIFRGIRTSKDFFNDLYGLNVITLFGLLPIYHRFCDASILTLLLALIMTMITTRLDRLGRNLIWLVFPFSIPGTFVLFDLGSRGIIPHSIVSKWWWTIFIMPHQVYLLISIIILLTFIIFNRRRNILKIFRKV